MRTGPDPDHPFPIPGAERVVFLAPLARDRANVEIGPYAYADLPEGSANFFAKQVLHHYPHMGDRLVIGAFAAIAEGAVFVMNGAAHDAGALSTYPFEIFGHGWEAGFEASDYPSRTKGDTVIGPDVWIGKDAMILPGTRIGPGAIIGARAVVSGDIPAYAVVAGNPGRELRRRFDERTAARLLELAWWDWPPSRILAAIPALRRGDISALEAVS